MQRPANLHFFFGLVFILYFVQALSYLICHAETVFATCPFMKESQGSGSTTGIDLEGELERFSIPYTEKKMAAVHFTTIPCEPNTVNRHIASHIFCQFHHCTNTIVYARLELYCEFL